MLITWFSPFKSKCSGESLLQKTGDSFTISLPFLHTKRGQKASPAPSFSILNSPLIG